MWSLPGPARFAAAIRTRLERGHSAAVGLPSGLRREEVFRRGLADAIDYAVDLVECQEAGDRPVASVVADWFSVQDVPPGREAPSALARHPTMRGRTVAIALAGDDRGSARVADFAGPFVAASRAVPVADRPRLVVLGDHACVAELTAGDSSVSGVWWWGVLDRLDTALHLRREIADHLDELVRDCVTEVAAFDLRLGEYLLATWDGSEATLAAALECYPDMPPGPLAPLVPLPHSSTALDAPPTALLDLWDRGLVDRWDSFPAYLHAGAVRGHADLRSRVWRAQMRALMPLIDEERARIEAWLRREVPGLPAKILEPSDLYAAFQDHPRLKSWRGGHRKRLVYWLRDARNALAHLGTIAPGDVARGRQLIADDRRHA